MNNKKIFLVLILFLLLFGKQSHATHIVGAELSYKCLDASIFLYEITLRFYRDCNLGTAEADSAFYVTIYDTSGNYMDSLIDRYLLTNTLKDTLYNETYLTCMFVSPDSVCVERNFYTAVVFLPPKPGGYYVSWQKCCRNKGLLNIPTPLSVGGSWFLNLPDTSIAKCNSTPIFDNYPPTVICLDQPINFDHAATDPDGDSLVYSLCWPYDGGAPTAATPVPIPPKPYANILYNGGYSYDNPLGGLDTLKIDPVTGQLSGIAHTAGQFVVGICVKEYRNGILIAENLRDFQYNVTRCDTFSISLFDYELDSCDNTLVKFINKSQNYHYWTWDFGDLTTLADTSPLFNPVWEYPDTGTYTATLILNAGLSCADTFSLQIPVLPNRVIPAFAHDSVCVGIPIAFTDLTTLIGNVGTISDWNWQFGDGGTSTLQNPVHTYGFQSNYLVSLIITTTSGCVMSATKQITVWPLPNVDAGPDVTIDISGNAPLNNAVSNAVTFLWEPGATLNDPTILNPVASPIVTTDYILTVTSAKGCQKSDTITVLIVIPAEIEVPDAFTPNQDGLNDVFLAYDVLGFEGKGIDEFNFYIFNRWGEVIFESDDITKGWDGTHGRSNKKSEIGTYVWLIKYNTQKDSDIKTLYGNVSLIR